MKKKLLSVLVCSLCLSSTLSIGSKEVFATELNNNTRIETIEATESYDSESIDWDSIDEIFVLYSENNEGDEFIKDAKDRGIKITYDDASIIKNIRFTYFKSISWIQRSGQWSLSLNPKSPYTINKKESWYEAVRFFQYHPIYTGINNSTKFTSMLNQYDCHVDYAKGLKTPWNIEPDKYDKGYWGFVKNLCN